MPEDIQLKLKEIEYERKYEELAVLMKLAMDRVKKQRDLAEVHGTHKEFLSLQVINLDWHDFECIIVWTDAM